MEWTVDAGSPPGPTRRAVAASLRDRGLAAEADHVEIVLGELLANAVRYRDGAIRVVVEVRERTVHLEVHDDGAPAAEAGRWPAEPHRPPGVDADGGRGLWIAQSLSDGLSVHARPGGTTVEADIALLGPELGRAGGQARSRPTRDAQRGSPVRANASSAFAPRNASRRSGSRRSSSGP